ncbi:phospholipase-like protein [Tanacetum coccineum]
MSDLYDIKISIWILESYPNSKKWWSKKANVIPRGLAWSKVTMFEKSDYEELFGPMSNPNVALISSPEKMSQAWFKASAEFIKGLDDQDGTFFQDDQGKICPKMNRMSVDDGDGVLDSQSDDGDGVLDSQTKDVIEQAAMLPTMSSNSPQAGNATLETSETFVKFKKLLTNDLCSENESSDCNQKKSNGGVSIEEKTNFSSHHNDSLNHIGGVSSEAKDGYSNSQHHLNLLIKALGIKIENPSIDAVVPPKVYDPMLRTIKPKYDFDEADVDSYDDDYMLLFNDEEQPAKSSLNDLELQQEPDKVDIKDGILEQQPNADKGKTTVIQETVGVTVKEGPSLGKDTTPVPTKRKTRLKKIDDIMLPFDLENLSRPDGCKSDKVTVPEYMSAFITNKDLPNWLTGLTTQGRLGDYKPSFLNMHLKWDDARLFLNDHMYPLPWIAIEKVYFFINEQKEHWCLAELEIRTGVVTFYDSLGWAGGSRRLWWRRMKKVLPEKLTLYLLMHGIFDSKGISSDDYKITYNYAFVPFQASLYGDCGIWVCIFIYRLCCNLRVEVDNDPLETTLAYRERMLECFWNHKILVE